MKISIKLNECRDLDFPTTMKDNHSFPFSSEFTLEKQDTLIDWWGVCVCVHMQENIQLLQELIKSIFSDEVLHLKR